MDRRTGLVLDLEDKVNGRTVVDTRTLSLTMVVAQPRPGQSSLDVVHGAWHVACLLQGSARETGHGVRARTGSVSSILSIHAPPCFLA